MRTFKEWLAKRNLSEIMVDPQTSTQVIGSLVGAQQVNNPSNVANNLVKRNPQLVAALVNNNPAADALKAAIARKNQNNNLNQINNVNNVIPPGTTVPMN